MCDLVANCSTVGPVGGIKVNEKAPVSVISSPAATAYLHNSTLALGYTVTDGGSGVATVGPTLDGAATVGGHGLASGQAINLLTEVPWAAHRLRPANGRRGRQCLQRLRLVPGDRHTGCPA